MAYNNRQDLRPQNQNNNQNVSFGRFADDTARRMVYDYLEVKDDDIGYKQAAFDYLDETPFVTIKSAVNNGDTFIYAVAEKSAINKHKNKNLFDDMIKLFYPKSSIEAKFLNKNARAVGATSEPGFLEELEGFTDAHNLYENFCDCEEGYYRKRGNSSPSSHVEDEEDYPYKKGYDFYRY